MYLLQCLDRTDLLICDDIALPERVCFLAALSVDGVVRIGELVKESHRLIVWNRLRQFDYAFMVNGISQTALAIWRK